MKPEMTHLISFNKRTFIYARMDRVIVEKPIEVFAKPDDFLIVISSSGQSENILCGVQAAGAG